MVRAGNVYYKLASLAHFRCYSQEINMYSKKICFI